MIEAKVEPVKRGNLKIKAVNLNKKQEAILRAAVEEVKKATGDDLTDVKIKFATEVQETAGW